MVMEFSDSVMNLDSHQINSSQMKQFVQVSECTTWHLKGDANP